MSQMRWLGTCGEACARFQTTTTTTPPRAPTHQAAHRQLQEALDDARVVHVLQRQGAAGSLGPALRPHPARACLLTLKGFMEFWMVGTIHCKEGRASAPRPPELPSSSNSPPHPRPAQPPAQPAYLLNQPHHELREEQLEEEAENSGLSPPVPGGPPAREAPSLQPHHLKEPPQQETLSDAGRAGEVELVTQGGGKEEVVQICNGRVGLAGGGGPAPSSPPPPGPSRVLTTVGQVVRVAHGALGSSPIGLLTRRSYEQVAGRGEAAMLPGSSPTAGGSPGWSQPQAAPHQPWPWP